MGLCVTQGLRCLDMRFTLSDWRIKYHDSCNTCAVPCQYIKIDLSRNCLCQTKWRIIYRRSTTERWWEPCILHFGSKKKRLKYSLQTSHCYQNLLLPYYFSFMGERVISSLGVGKCPQGVLGLFWFFKKGSLEVSEVWIIFHQCAE